MIEMFFAVLILLVALAASVALLIKLPWWAALGVLAALVLLVEWAIRNSGLCNDDGEGEG